jgi:phenylacetate-CoA ligase
MNLFTSAYAPAYRNLVFPLYEGVLRRRGIYDRYRRLSEAPALGIDELREMQRRKLNDLVVYCNEHVPFYRELFAEHGVDPRGVFDVEALRAKEIFTSKPIVRSAGDSILSREFVKEDLHNSATSGSTGTPVLFYMSRDNWCLRMATKYRSEDWIGKPLGTPATLIWGHKPVRTRRAIFKNSLYWAFQNYQFLSAFDIGEESLVAAVASIRRHGSRFIESYVTVVYLMAKAIAKYGLEPPKLDGIVVGAERLYDFQKEEIERSFRCSVFNRYGATEFSNVASECEKREGLHVNMDNLWVEVVDGDDRPVTGQVGDIVVTDLENRAMPLIRYRIGDRGVMTDAACSCGRSFPMLREVVGRDSETMKTEGGREIHDMYFLWKLSRAPGLVRFRVTQDSLTHVRVDIEHDGSVDREVTSRWIAEALRDLERYRVSHTLEYVDSIPLTGAGKMRFFVSELAGEEGTPGRKTR